MVGARNSDKSKLLSRPETLFLFKILTDLTCVLPVHGVDGGSRVHVHQVVVVVASHHPAPRPHVVELHPRHAHTMCRGVAAPPSYLDNCHTPTGACLGAQPVSTLTSQMSVILLVHHR